MSELVKIKATLDKVAGLHDVIITDLIWRNDSGNKILEIPIMFDDGSMDLETCGLMSQHFIDALEDVDQLNFEYFIDVCSPGAERVLNTYEDIKRELNKHVYVKLANPKAGFHEIIGTLIKVNKESISVEYMDKTRKKVFEIALSNIGLIRLAVKI